MKNFVLFLSCFVCFSTFAQEMPNFETIVEDVIFSTSNRIVIDEKAIKESRAPNITSLLSSQANITIASTPFQPNSIYIRGGDSGHVLILVDGVPFYDASTVQRTFNLNSLDIKSVRKIEIVKGSQTVLYGGQALSGVIKIETLPQEFDSKTGAQGQIGTQQTRDISLTHIEKINDEHAAVLRGQGAWKDVSSPVLESSQTYPKNTWNTEAAYVFKGPLEGHIKGLYIQELNYSPSSDNFKIVDADDFKQFSRQLGVSSSVKLANHNWEPKLAVSMQNSIRQYDMPLISDDDYGANLRTVRLDISPFKIESVKIFAGLSYIYEDFVYRDRGIEKSNSLSEQKGVFAKADVLLMKNLEFTAGGRVEGWSDKEPATTYQAGITAFENTRLEVATGYKIPSAFQLYSTYGNPDLKEERSIQYSLSQDIPLGEKHQVSITLFDSHFSNLIVTQGSYTTLKYANVNKTETRGAELIYSVHPTENSAVFLAYGYQEPRDTDNNRWLARRPLVNGSIKYQYSRGMHSGSFEVIGVGERLDRNGNSTFTSLPGYMTSNASYSYELRAGFSAYTRLNNLFNYRYQDTYSYYTEGFSGVIGGEYWF